MDLDLAIRRLREGEIETLVDDLWLPFAAEMAALDQYNELADDVREDALVYRRNRLDDEDSATFVADAGERVVGYTVVGYEESPPVFARGPTGNIEEVYVVPERRTEGIATELMDRAEAWAAEWGCERVELSVNASNGSARRLYESRGYSVRRHKMDRSVG